MKNRNNELYYEGWDKVVSSSLISFNSKIYYLIEIIGKEKFFILILSIFILGNSWTFLEKILLFMLNELNYF